MHPALEELLPNDGINDDHEEDQQGDVEQGHHSLDDGVKDDLKTCTKKREELNCFLNSFGCFIPASPSDKQLLEYPVPREEGHRWVGTEISAARNPFSTHNADPSTARAQAVLEAALCPALCPSLCRSHPGSIHVSCDRRRFLP